MPKKTFTCAEEEIATQLYSLGVACHHFGWQQPADHIFAARAKILEHLTKTKSKPRVVASC